MLRRTTKAGFLDGQPTWEMVMRKMLRRTTKAGFLDGQPTWVVRPGGARAHSPTRLCAFPLPPLPPCCCPLFVSSSSFSLVILTLNIAGCLCSALEFIMCVALDDWILTASVFCRVSGFLNTPSTVMLKFSMLPCSFGWKRARCFAKAFVSFLLTTSPSCWSHRCDPGNPLSPQYSADSPRASHSLHPPLYNDEGTLWGPPAPPLTRSRTQPGRPHGSPLFKSGWTSILP